MIDLAIAERVLSIVLPIIGVVSIGALYGLWRKPDISILNQVNMDVFVPMLVFSVLIDRSVDIVHLGQLAAAATWVIIGSGLVLWPIIKLSPWQVKTLVPPMMFNNVGNLGIPLMILTFGSDFLAVAMVFFLVEMILHFTLGVYLIRPNKGIIGVFRQPMIIATIAGLALASTGVRPPEVIQIPLSMLGEICIPLMLFTLGMRMLDVNFQDWRLGLAGAILCPLSGLAMALTVPLFIDLSSEHYTALLLFSVLPPAVLNYMVAEQLQQEPQRVAAIVLISNLSAVLTIPITLAIIL
ncbi:MAG: AEC family transporter [Gammaproteobacteria bacterium]|jgi:hypothetical protein|nr:AEC family transporter [Gammaproteobacteria bacterium]